MTRKAISDSVQTSILLKSRRRCCICFWLEGIDEVKKGQIAHVDQNNENANEDNLVFLCLDHHDEYDGSPSVSKGLRESEVRRWRDELYREMEYRFRTVKRHGFDLRFVGIVWREGWIHAAARFRLKNTGDCAAKRPTISFRLPDWIGGAKPVKEHGLNDIMQMEMEVFDPWGMTESIQDFFEEGGRVGMVQVVGGPDPQLLSGHSEEFDGLSIPLSKDSLGLTFELEYRVDSEDSPPLCGRVDVAFPKSFDELIIDD